MTTRQARVATEIILAAVTLGLIAWDIVADFGAGVDATISEVLLRFFYGHPAVAAIFGGIIGHVTWPRRLVAIRKGHFAVVIAALATLALADVFRVFAPVTPLWPLLAGLPVGHFLWPQSRAVIEMGDGNRAFRKR